MSRLPTGTFFFSICWMSLAMGSARGTPRRLMPTRVRFSTPLFFSTISCASRTRVRSISEPDINCAFSRSGALREGLRGCAGELMPKVDDIRREKQLFASAKRRLRSPVLGRKHRCSGNRADDGKDDEEHCKQQNDYGEQRREPIR